MKRISWSCLIVGVISIILSVIGIFIPLDGFVGWNLPFQILIISLQCGSIVVKKLGNFIDILRLQFFDYIFSTILVVSGIGTLWMKSWGRILGHIYAISIILISGIAFPIILIGYIREFSMIEKYGFLQGLIWGGHLLIFLLSSVLYYTQ